MNATATYSAALHYRRDDGTTGCVVTIPKAYGDNVRYYRDELGWPIVGEEWTGYCGSCKGKGKVPGKRHGFKRCPACKGDRAEWVATQAEAMASLHAMKGASR